jgi:hypothetical protein
MVLGMAGVVQRCGDVDGVVQANVTLNVKGTASQLQRAACNLLAGRKHSVAHSDCQHGMLWHASATVWLPYCKLHSVCTCNYSTSRRTHPLTSYSLYCHC